LISKILSFRSYANAKDIYDKTPMDKRPKTRSIELVSEITMGLAKRQIQEAQVKIAEQESQL
jgi:hypothetical protein